MAIHCCTVSLTDEALDEPPRLLAQLQGKQEKQGQQEKQEQPQQQQGGAGAEVGSTKHATAAPEAQGRGDASVVVELPGGAYPPFLCVGHGERVEVDAAGGLVNRPRLLGVQMG